MSSAYVERRLEHFKQQSNWDCGVACVLMVLPRRERERFLADFGRVCREEGFGRSTWTIDLCYLLRRFGVRHRYCTVTMGVHPTYRGDSYYERLMANDELRITRKFESAIKENSIRIDCNSLPMDALVDHLKLHGPIILLINANLLACDICKSNKLNVELRSCFPWAVQYMGHYVVLCGYNGRKKKILYRNPTHTDRLCAISYRGLDAARKSHGTDEDAIFIFEDAFNGRQSVS